MTYETSEVELWSSSSKLEPPGDIRKLPKQDLQRWLDRLTTAIRRHEYLRSTSGRQMIVLSIQQSIARLRASEISFNDWLENSSEKSLARLQRMLSQAEAVVAERQRSTARSPSPHKQTSKVTKMLESLGLAGDEVDVDMQRSIIAKFGSVEAFAATLK